MGGAFGCLLISERPGLARGDANLLENHLGNTGDCGLDVL